MSEKGRMIWTFAVTSIALFMVVLDNLVVSTAIPVIRVDLDASIEQLEWTVNAYTLTFAVLLLTGAALGDRLGRRRVFLGGLAIGAWSGIAGLAVAAGPLVGGVVVEGISWQWIFWLNVPVGLALLPLGLRLRESYGPDKAIDVGGLALASGGLL